MKIEVPMSMRLATWSEVFVGPDRQLSSC